MGTPTSIKPILPTGSPSTGEPIEITAQSDPTAQEIHTCVNNANDVDQVDLFAYNSGSFNETLELKRGGETQQISIPPTGNVPFVSR